MTLSVTSLLVASACTAYSLTRTPIGPALGVESAPPCTLSAGDLTRAWTREQAMTVTTVAAVGHRIGATGNGVAAAVARALKHVDEQVVDAERARAIYRALPDRTRPSGAAQAVADALLGGAGPALTCTVPVFEAARGLSAEEPGATGLTPRAEAVRLAMRDVFGKQILGGFAPGGVSTGHMEGSAHYEGRAIDVFFRPISAENTARGWLQAQWLVAHATQLDIATVIFDRQVWTASRSLSGWRDYGAPDGPTDNPVLLHEDHVHVDVHEGTSSPG